MRLTLRTLLAYLDDTLDPAESKAIGKKIADSPTARELIGRIRELVRRRRITAPPLNGPGAKFDANTVGEYIDNLLPADELAEFEEGCLNDDVYLAEIAACHQILTVVLSEPAKVPPMARQRMYALIRGPEAIPYRKAARPAVESASAGADRERDETEDMLLMGLPFYRGQGGWLRRLAPIGLGLLGILVLAAIILPSGRDRKDAAEADRVAENKPKKTPATQPVAPPEKVEPKNPDATGPAATVPTPDKTDPTKSPTSDAKDQKKPDEAVATPSNPASTPPASGDSQPAGTGERKALGKHVVNTGESAILLQRASGQSPWQRLTADSPVNSDDELLSLPGCRSRLQLGRGVNAVLWGTLPGDGAPVPLYESSASFRDSQDADLDLALLRGRVRISNTKQASAKARVRFKGETWELVMEPGAEAALELSGSPAFDFAKEGGKSPGPQAILALFVLKGQVDLKAGFRSHLMREPPGPAMFFWSSISGPAPGPQPQSSLPAWANVSRNQVSKVSQLIDGLSKRLTGRTTAEEAITEMAKESDPTSARLGIHCLAAIGSLSTLLDELANERSPEGRRASIDALRFWIGQRPENDQSLYSALEKKYRAGPAEVIMHLLHGFSQDTRAKPETFEYLIEYLKSDKLAVRELAWMNLLLMPETQEIAKAIPFDPAGGVDQRTAAYSRWKEIVPDGKMPPKGPITPAKR